MRAWAALLFIGLVLMAIAWAKDPKPPLLVDDTTGSSAFHHAQAADPRGGEGARIAPCITINPPPRPPGAHA